MLRIQIGLNQKRGIRVCQNMNPGVISSRIGTARIQYLANGNMGYFFRVSGSNIRVI